MEASSSGIRERKRERHLATSSLQVTTADPSVSETQIIPQSVTLTNTSNTLVYIQHVIANEVHFSALSSDDVLFVLCCWSNANMKQEEFSDRPLCCGVGVTLSMKGDISFLFHI